MKYLIFIFGILTFFSCQENTSKDDKSLVKENIPEQSDMVFSTSLESELNTMKSEVASMYKDGILFDLIFKEDSTLYIISDIAVQSNNYNGYIMFDETTPVLIYSKTSLKHLLKECLNASKIKFGSPPGYKNYDSIDLLPPFEPYMRKYKLKKGGSLEFIESKYI